MRIRELIERGRQALIESSSSARLDAEVLLMHLLHYDRTALIVRAEDLCSESTVSEYECMIARRQRGEPIAYITGEREFWGLSFKVTPDVLIPRPESELIIEEALRVIEGLSAPRIVDLGTGSGALAIALIHELRARGIDNAQCVAVDLSEAALRIAQENATRVGVQDAIILVQSNWFSERERFSAPYDLIIANPPYVSHAETVPVELSYEPQSALFADDEGLKDCKEILRQSRSMLKDCGVLLCEVGAGKRRLLTEWVSGGEVPGARVSYLGDDSVDDRFMVVKAVWS